jgi:hypothetical protein|tara:strand:+ start:166 stop:279 length:114 start_codon:yes stop_codon:yes gene_type:complete
MAREKNKKEIKMTISKKRKNYDILPDELEEDYIVWVW